MGPLVIPIIALITALAGIGVGVAEAVEGDKRRAHDMRLAGISLAAQEEAEKEARKAERQRRRRERRKARREAEAIEAEPPDNLLLPIGAGVAVLGLLAYTMGKGA